VACGSSASDSVQQLDTTDQFDRVLSRDQKARKVRYRVTVLGGARSHAYIGRHHLVLCKNLFHLKRRCHEIRILELFGGINHANEAVGVANGNEGPIAGVDFGSHTNLKVSGINESKGIVGVRERIRFSVQFAQK
jgi:hypothetical protein